MHSIPLNGEPHTSAHVFPSEISYIIQCKRDKPNFDSPSKQALTQARPSMIFKQAKAVCALPARYPTTCLSKHGVAHKHALHPIQGEEIHQGIILPVRSAAFAGSYLAVRYDLKLIIPSGPRVSDLGPLRKC